jgi:hypothetical protein
MGVPFRETEGGVERKNAELAGTSTTHRINERLLISNLDEHVSRYRAVLADLPESALLIVIMFPCPLQEIRNDRFGGLRRTELNPLAEREVDKIIRKGFDVVERKLRLTKLTTVCPMMT